MNQRQATPSKSLWRLQGHPRVLTVLPETTTSREWGRSAHATARTAPVQDEHEQEAANNRHDERTDAA
jgi:hypothetical protein